MDKADQIIDELYTLTREQLNELIALFYKAKAEQDNSKTCAR